MSSIPNWLSHRALQKRNHPALLFEGKTWTFADLDLISRHIALKLAGMGIGAGSCVAILLSNHPGSIVLLHALSKLGAIAVLINIRLTAQEIEWQLQDCQAQLLVYDRTTYDRASQLRSWRSLDIDELEGGTIPCRMPTVAHIALPLSTDIDVSSTARNLTSPQPLSSKERGLKALYFLAPPSPRRRGRLGGRGSSNSRDIELEAVQAIVYTSGTTGVPKGVQLTYGNHWNSAIASAMNIGMDSSDRWLLCLPLYHVGGMAIMWRSLIYGTTVILQQRFDAEAVIRAIATEQVTMLSLVPTMLTRILENAQFPGSLTHWQNLRGILLGGAAPSQTLLNRCLELKLPIMPTYGLTEAASQVTTLLPQDLDRKPGSSGQPLLCDRIRIVAIEDEHTEVAVGEVGQILVQGTNVMKGYINRSPDANKEGWLHTGDLGYVDREGFLYVVSRRSDLIISGGENIYPTEVEMILCQHPAIVEACVVGTEDPEWGQVVTAVAIAKQPITLDEIQTFCTSHHLARYKLPRILHVVEVLPRTANGKLSRQRVREFVVKIVDS